MSFHLNQYGDGPLDRTDGPYRMVLCGCLVTMASEKYPGHGSLFVITYQVAVNALRGLRAFVGAGYAEAIFVYIKDRGVTGGERELGRLEIRAEW